MKARPSIENVVWMIAGAVVLAVLTLILYQFRRDPAQQLASKASRADLVAQMQLALASAAEAEKSAVLAVGDQESQTFADHARAATAEVERKRQELGKELATGGTERERELLGQFTEALGALRRIDEEVLRLAVKNTNLKAYGLLFGPAAEALAEMDGALSRVVAKRGEPPGGAQVLPRASAARIGVLRIQALLAPHIAEEDDSKMDRMEAAMLEEEVQVRKDLEALAEQPKLGGDADLATAASAFARYGELKTRILALSRENTNVQSLALSLHQKRKAMTFCLEPLNALKQAILDEPIAGVTYGRLPTR